LRIKINFTQPFTFSTTVKVLINHINFGGHVGNDSFLSIIHEARIAYLKQWNYTELSCGGVALIMVDSALQYKAESYHNDKLNIEIYAALTSPKSFDLFYKITTNRIDKSIDIAYAKTGMLAFDYVNKKVAYLPAEFIQKIEQ
jgi:acyl-CoA thioesterase FadM